MWPLYIASAYNTSRSREVKNPQRNNNAHEAFFDLVSGKDQVLFLIPHSDKTGLISLRPGSLLPRSRSQTHMHRHTHPHSHTGDDPSWGGIHSVERIDVILYMRFTPHLAGLSSVRGLHRPVRGVALDWGAGLYIVLLLSFASFMLYGACLYTRLLTGRALTACSPHPAGGTDVSSYCPDQLLCELLFPHHLTVQ